MFGCICAGRQVQTNLQVVSETEFLFSLPSAQLVNHIVIFLLPTTQLPPDYAATVYFQWPGKPFQLLGGLSMEKQSAIFRLKGNTASLQAGNNSAAAAAGIGGIDEMLDDSMSAGNTYANGPFVGAENVTAQLGISVEPIAQAQQKLMALPAHLSSLTSSVNMPYAENALVPRSKTQSPGASNNGGGNATTLILARKIIQNAFNYLGSFSSGPPGAEMVPMREFQNWWTRFEHKLSVDSGFLEREDT